jgi:hypothetical protein
VATNVILVFLKNSYYLLKYIFQLTIGQDYYKYLLFIKLLLKHLPCKLKALSSNSSIGTKILFVYFKVLRDSFWKTFKTVVFQVFSFFQSSTLTSIFYVSVPKILAEKVRSWQLGISMLQVDCNYLKCFF